MRAAWLIIVSLAACGAPQPADTDPSTTTGADPSTPSASDADPTGDETNAGGPTGTTPDWTVADCVADRGGPGDGWDEGDILPDFALTDQHGDTVHLRDLCDRTVLVLGTAFW